MEEATHRQLNDLAEEVLRKTDIFQKERRETVWLKEKYERFRRDMGISRGDCDSFLYEKTFAKAADRASDAQRIRFWRTGKYYPKTRIACESFAKAMELDPAETVYLLQAWFDRGDRCFSERDVGDPVYQKRVALMSGLAEEFLEKIPPAELAKLCAPGTSVQQNLRHIYCVRAAGMVHLPKQMGEASFAASRHIADASYAGQFSEEMRLLGDISRTTILRHLLLFSMPFISTGVINERLLLLGYRPLQEENSDRNGHAADLCLLKLMDLYESCCAGFSPDVCSRWLREAAVWLDEFFAARGRQGLRLFAFKHIQNRLQAGGM